MTPIDFVLFEGDSNPNQPVHEVVQAMKNTIKIFVDGSELEVYSYYFHAGQMVLELTEKNT